MREYLAEEIATDFADALLTRREALRRLALVGLSTSAAVALLAACGGGSGGGGDKNKTTGTKAPAAPRTAEPVRFQGPNGELQGAWAAASKPTGENPDFSQSKAAVLGIYAELDARVNATRDAAEAALQAAGLTHEMRTFPGVDHAFFNDTGPRYNAAVAAEAYQAVLAWFAAHLR